MVTPLSYFELVEAFSGPGCAICSLLLRDVDRFLDSILYEHVTDPDSQRKFRASRGLCNEHSWQLVQHKGNSLGIAVLYGAIIRDVLKALEQAEQPGLARKLGIQSVRRALETELEPSGPCSACRAQADSQRRYVQVLGEYMPDSKLQGAYRGSDGLCLPHFGQALKRIRSDDLRTFVTIQRDCWSRLQADLEEFEAKNDYRRIREAMGAEGDSWLRAVEHVAGKKGIFGNRKT